MLCLLDVLSDTSQDFAQETVTGADKWFPAKEAQASAAQVPMRKRGHEGRRSRDRWTKDTHTHMHTHTPVLAPTSTPPRAPLYLHLHPHPHARPWACTHAGPTHLPGVRTQHTNFISQNYRQCVECGAHGSHPCITCSCSSKGSHELGIRWGNRASAAEPLPEA